MNLSKNCIIKISHLVKQGGFELDFFSNDEINGIHVFESRWEKFYRYKTLEGKPRKHPIFKEHGNATLRGREQKLFFLLVYLKTNSLQEHQAASFGLSQSKVSRTVKTLLPILNQALKDMDFVPQMV